MRVRIDCTDDGGDLTEEITPAPNDRYYLVVPHNPNDEGSYGTDAAAAERPAGGAVCAVLADEVLMDGVIARAIEIGVLWIDEGPIEPDPCSTLTGP